MELSTDQKGAIAESAIVHAAIKLGIGVFRPLSDGERYDLIFDLRPRLVRVQVKWAPRHGDVVVVRAYSNRRSCAPGYDRRRYWPSEIDGFAAYCPHLDRRFFVPGAAFRPRAHASSCAEPEQPAASDQLGRRLRVRAATIRASRGRSSAGRAFGWHPKGQGFDPPRLHTFTAAYAIFEGAAEAPLAPQEQRCPLMGVEVACVCAVSPDAGVPTW